MKKTRSDRGNYDKFVYTDASQLREVKPVAGTRPGTEVPVRTPAGGTERVGDSAQPARGPKGSDG